MTAQGITASLGTLPVRCDDCSHPAHEPYGCTGLVTRPDGYGGDADDQPCPCDIGVEGWRLTERPDLPSDFAWFHGAIDCDDPIVVTHAGGAVGCRRVMHEFSNARAARAWAIAHECGGAA